MGGGQFIFANHFDNPNNGPMYTDDSYTTLTESYRDNSTVNGNQNSDNWIQNALDQINANRGVYNQVNQNNGQYNISTLIGRFGQNTHTLADFYAHTNCVDATNYRYYEGYSWRRHQAVDLSIMHLITLFSAPA
jgi:hypothetical protein